MLWVGVERQVFFSRTSTRVPLALKYFCHPKSSTEYVTLESEITYEPACEILELVEYYLALSPPFRANAAFGLVCGLTFQSIAIVKSRWTLFLGKHRLCAHILQLLGHCIAMWSLVKLTEIGTSWGRG